MKPSTKELEKEEGSKMKEPEPKLLNLGYVQLKSLGLLFSRHPCGLRVTQILEEVSKPYFVVWRGLETLREMGLVTKRATRTNRVSYKITPSGTEQLGRRYMERW